MEAARMGFGPKTISILPLSLKTNLSIFPPCLFRNYTISWKPTNRNSLVVKANSENLESTRPLTHFRPSFWGDHFLSTTVDRSEFDALATEIDSILKPKVRDMLMSSYGGDKERIRMIHLLISLGVSHHFEMEIEVILSRAFQNLEEIITEENDLETISITFEVFRLYGHNISCDVLDRFKGDDGKFKESLAEDVRGMLQLHEAAHLGTPSEVIMDEALSFTTKHLQSFARHGESPHLSKHIKHTLYSPRYHNFELLVAREYISFYSQEESHNETLLHFAKLNFNFQQLHYIQEMKTLTIWWKDLDLASKLPYIRDRIVETYFATLGIFYEPRYSLGRIIVAKIVMVVVAMDDTCDAFATFPEVKSFIDTLQRWDCGAVDDELPIYLRVVLQTLIEMMKDIEREMKPRGRFSSVQHTIEEIKSLGRAYAQISKWAHTGYVPNFEEYMEVGLASAGMNDFACYSFIAMEDCDEKQIYKWFDSEPKIFQALDYLFRLRNDIATFEQEMSRGQVANGVNCYMRQHGVTKEEAVLKLKKICRDNYKVTIQEFLTTTDVPRPVLVRCLNIARMVDMFYKEGDEFTLIHENLIDRITSVFLHPIPL